MIRTDTGYVRNINWIFVAIVSIIFLIAMWQIRSILMLCVAGVMLTIVASMPVRFFMRFKINRGISIILSILSGIVLIILMSLLVFPTLFSQFTVLFTDIIPGGITRLIELWNSGELADRVPILQQAIDNFRTSGFEINADLINQAIQQVTTALQQVGGSIIPLLGGVTSVIVSFTIVFFLTMYLLAEPDKYIHGVILLTPLWYRDRMREILVRMDTTIRAWVKVTGLSMLLVGVGTGLGLYFVGVQQWLALGVLAGVLSFVPNFGTILALIPALAVAIIQVPESFLLVLIIIVVVSFIQAQIVGPILTADSMNLPPVLILVGQIIFGIFFGFLGLMLAVPLTAISVVLVEEIYVKDILGDTSSSTKVKAKLETSETGIVFAESD
jgi:predicted PurR-regulated permease PerM